jgi:hypothetical protein
MADINKIFSNGTLYKIILIIFFSLYLIFPSGSSTIDGWNYAANIKHAGEIFHPHHLLYNAFGYVFCYLPAKLGIGVLECMKALNAIFAVLTLLMVQLILRRLGKNEFSVFIISCLAGFSFSVMRFATENETYIIPLFFSLTASYNYLKFTLTATPKYAFYSGIWATISVLFHQIFIFWWLGILIGIILSKKIKPVLWYGLVSITGPLVYLIVILIISGILRWGTIINFLSGDFPGNAQLGISGKGLLFSGVNLIRSFIQVHGYIFNMIRSYPLLLVPCILSLVLFFLAFLKMPVKKLTARTSDFAGIHILILILQFLFAMLAAGNAEFMIMIPVLVFILVAVLFDNYERFLLRIMYGIAIWNLAYGIIPLHFNVPEAEEYLCNAALDKKQVIVIALDDQLLKSMIYYQEGKSKVENIYKSPAVMRIKGTDVHFLDNVIDSALNKGLVIYTDCIGNRSISRAVISEGSTNAEFFSKYKTVEIRSWESIMGRKVVTRIIAKL